MDESTLDLLVTPFPGAAAVRTRITKLLTTVGSAPDADVRLAMVAPRWAVIQRNDSGLAVRMLGQGSVHRLGPSQRVTLDGVTLEAAPRTAEPESLPVQQLSEALCGVEAAPEALRMMLRGIVDAAKADVGAIVISEGGEYTVAVAELGDRKPLEKPAELLSDTILRDVLTRSQAVFLQDAAADSRYSTVLSVTTLHLRSVLCVPMVLSGRVLGAIFLGRHDARKAFTERQAADLGVLAAMTVPLLVQLRRTDSGSGISGDHIIGECTAIRKVRRLVEKVAASDVSVLILGETGTGKEVCARAIHAASRRAGRPMVAINCSAVPEGLLGTELFGCKKGAYTGALSDRKGSIEEADGSTLFLDEVGDMPLPMQAALLRVLEQREVIRLGENIPRKIDFRLVAATNRDLDEEVAAGRFRADLLFRLKEISLTLPPLAERRDDIPLLAQLFLRQAEAQFCLPLHRISESARVALQQYNWPGNVRELRAAMRRAALMCDGLEIVGDDLGIDSDSVDSSKTPRDGKAAAMGIIGDLDRTLAEAREEFDGTYIAAVLERHHGNRENAATSLGISIRSLYRLLEKP